jgi:hydrogenase nickel incorporation protein HypB
MTTEVSVARDVLEDNAEGARKNRETFAKAGVYVLNLMSGPGAGKTTLLERTAATLGKKIRMAMVTGDIATRRDAERIERHGVPSWPWLSFMRRRSGRSRPVGALPIFSS